MEKIPNSVVLKLRKSPWIRRRSICHALKEHQFFLNNQIEYKRYKKAFDFLDVDKDGVISGSDIKNIFELMGEEKPTDDRINRWIKAFDMNQDVQITFEEFVATLIVKMETFLTNHDIMCLFEKCDLKDEGCITLDNLIQIMASLGKELSIEEAQLMIGNAGSRCCERIEFNEFYRMMRIMRKDILFCVGSILAT